MTHTCTEHTVHRSGRKAWTTPRIVDCDQGLDDIEVGVGLFNDGVINLLDS